MIKRTARIRLLPKVEIEDLYARPDFNDYERTCYFTLNIDEIKYVHHYENIKTKLYFILQLGYFKAKQQFFNFNFEDAEKDVNYIASNFLNTKQDFTAKISAKYIKKQQQHILTLFNYQNWSSSLKPQIKNYLAELIKTHPKSHNAFRELLNYFEHHQIIIPTYRTFQDLFTEVFKIEKNRLSNVIEKLPTDKKIELESLIKNDNGLSQLNIMRADQKNFKYRAIKREVEKVKKLSALYQTAKEFIPTLGISKNAVRYYADITEHYSASRLRRMDKSQQLLYLICFVFHRYQQLVDNLITSFIYHVKLMIEACKLYVDAAQKEHESKLFIQLPKLSKFLQWFPKQEKNPNITFTALSKKAYKILPKKNFDTLANYIAGISFDKNAARKKYYSKYSRTISLYLRPMLLALDLEYYEENSSIMSLINIIKEHYSAGKSPSALKISDELELLLPKDKIDYLKLKPTDKYIDPHLFEFYIYQKICHHIERGRLFCNDSISYADLEQDLVPEDMVDRVEEIANKFGYSKIPIYCDEHLDNMIKKLDDAWESTTQAIATGKNESIKITKTGEKECDLVLMSKKIEVDPNLAEESKLYLKSNGYYISRYHGKIYTGSLLEEEHSNSEICLLSLEKKILDSTFKRQVLTITSKRGHTCKNEDWSLLYDASDQIDDTFFSKLPKIEITQLVKFIGDKISIWKGFNHIKDRYIKRDVPEEIGLNACLLLEAFGIDIQKMADISDLNFNFLKSIHEDFFRIETLCNGNDIVGNFISTLPIFKLWNLYNDKLVADADGQKFATSNNTIQSRFSKKYLGKGTGISLYTLLANFVAVNAKNIGLNEYEGHSLYDMIYGNKTDIEINMVTGDNHSINQLNAIFLDSINVDYVPNIKNIREAADKLYSIKSPEYYTGLIKPKGKINIERIKSQKRGILRVLLSLLIQDNTQSTIIRKLNSQARHIRLKAGLFEYNKIFNSIHVLELINNMPLRKALKTARCRTESYHQLQRFIRKIYHGIFKGKKIIDNRTSAHAVRLLANCIIAYNCIILNAVYEKMIEEGASSETLKEFAKISPIAWSHLLFEGRYNFIQDSMDINIALMAEELKKFIDKYFNKANVTT